MDLLSAQEIERKRVIVDNPAAFFSLVKKSPKYVSWKELVKTAGCGNTTLKHCRRGKRTINGKLFLKLLDYLNEGQKEQVFSNIEFLDLNWGACEGGLQSIRRLKERLGENGFLKHLKKVRENAGSPLSVWHKTMKEEKPEEYHEIQRKRWLTALAFWRNSPRAKEKRIKTLKARFGEHHFSSLGLKTAENQELTPREKLVKKEIFGLGFEVETHKTISNHNFDFTFNKQGELKAVEEVLGFKKKKSHVFYQLLILFQKYGDVVSKYRVPFFVSTWYEVDLGYKRERVPIELLLWAYEKGMIPVLMDNGNFHNLRADVLNGNEWKTKITGVLKSNLSQRKKLLFQGAKSQFKQPFDELEQITNNKMGLIGLNPQGKKLLETRFGTFTVSDNFFNLNGQDFAVFVSNNDLPGIIGSSAIVKELISSKIKTVGILFGSNKRNFKTRVQRTLLNSYVDYFYNSIEEFEKIFGLVV